MSTQQTTVQTASNRALAEQVYNMLMEQIEPDLMLENIPLQDAKYAGETSEARTQRMTRYLDAYKQFDAQVSDFASKFDAKVRQTKRTSLHSKETAEKQTEEDKLQFIASAIG